MWCDARELDFLLGDVSADRAAMGARHMPLFTEEKPGSNAALYETDAVWVVRPDYGKALCGGPRHLTLRRRGSATSYAGSSDLTQGVPGRLILLKEGLSLEPGNSRKPCIHIPADGIEQVSFYADCADLLLSDRKRILIQCADVDILNLKFEAHYARPRCA